MSDPRRAASSTHTHTHAHTRTHTHTHIHTYTYLRSFSILSNMDKTIIILQNNN